MGFGVWRLVAPASKESLVVFVLSAFVIDYWIEMNICVVCQRYPYKNNMVHVFVQKLVNEWALLGHSCFVISPISLVGIANKEEYPPAYERQYVTGSKFVEVFRPRYLPIPIKVAGISINSRIRQCVIDKVLTHINRHNGIDIVYCHFFSIAFETWHFISKSHLPFFVATGESSYPAFYKPSKSFSLEVFSKTLTGVVAVSSKNLMESVSLGYTSIEKCKVFPNGTDISHFDRLDRDECRNKLGIDASDFVIVCVGQFIERKGQQRLLDAIDRTGLPIKTIFIGKGPQPPSHGSIVFKDVVKNKDLPIYLNAANVFVLPTRKEGCCNAIIEALACGLPIISSDRDFNKDILNENNSLLVDPDDIDDIAKSIKRMYTDSDFRESIAENAYVSGREFSISKRASNILAFMMNRSV